MTTGRFLATGILLLALLSFASVFVGASRVSPLDVLAGTADPLATLVLWESRIPRTLALVLAGASMAVAGTIMQMLARNRFVEPSTAGTVESASLGMLVVLLLAPGLPVFGKMLAAALFALAGTALFLGLLRRTPLRSALMVPLIGLMLGGVIRAATVFLAYRFDMLQSMGAWTSGDFSTVLAGRYEVLWAAFALAVAAYVAADRFTLAGLGESFATGLGANYRRILDLGLVIVALVTASVVVTAGVIPFVGLVVPNLVALTAGDNLRRTLPFTALGGAMLVLACDILGRVAIAPYEIPVGTVLGVVGSVAFLALLLRRRARVS
jgi:iron complex transport system permease protein